MSQMRNVAAQQHSMMLSCNMDNYWIISVEIVGYCICQGICPMNLGRGLGEISLVDQTHFPPGGDCSLTIISFVVSNKNEAGIHWIAGFLLGAEEKFGLGFFQPFLSRNNDGEKSVGNLQVVKNPAKAKIPIAENPKGNPLLIQGVEDLKSVGSQFPAFFFFKVLIECLGKGGV